jgi:hypothetical protein
MADGDDVVALGAGMVETPCFFGDGAGEEGFHYGKPGADWCEVGHHFGAEIVVFDAFFVGHDCGLGGDAVSAGVLTGGFLAFGAAGAGGFFGVRAVGCELFGRYGHLVLLLVGRFSRLNFSGILLPTIRFDQTEMELEWDCL